MSKGTILVVDDELMICQTLVKLLGEADYQVDYRTVSPEGLEAVKNKQYDAVLLDIMMPQMDGIALLKEIKKIDPLLPIIMITGVPSDETVNKAMIFGAYDYIAKPFGKEKIYFIIERAVSYRKVLVAAYKKQ